MLKRRFSKCDFPHWFQAILCNTTTLVRSDIHNMPSPYGLTNVIEKFYRVVLADWIPHWFVKKTEEVGKCFFSPGSDLSLIMGYCDCAECV